MAARFCVQPVFAIRRAREKVSVQPPKLARLPRVTRILKTAIPVLLAALSLRAPRSLAKENAPWTERGVHDADVHGTLFVHPGAPRPAMLVLGGGPDGHTTPRTSAMHLADLGYNVFTLAYSTRAGKKHLDHVPLETFLHALDWLHRQTFTGTETIGMLGCSKDSEAALLTACLRDDIAVVIAYSPSHVVWECRCDGHGPAGSSWTWHGQDLPFIPYKRMVPIHAGFADGWNCERDLCLGSLHAASADIVARAEIPVEKIHAPLLLLSGGADTVAPALDCAHAIAARLEKERSRIAFKSVIYPQAGHSFIEGTSDGGGTDPANRAAEKESMHELEKFLAEKFPLAVVK